jgi:hypothetical protein
MTTRDIKVKVGDRVIISRPNSIRQFAANIERFSTVSAVREKSFDAGGLCFRNDGREWVGHSRVRLTSKGKGELNIDSLVGDWEAARLERAERRREDVMLAFLLSHRHEKDWLKLGLDELRRIAALHGMRSRKIQPVETSQMNAGE